MSRWTHERFRPRPDRDELEALEARWERKQAHDREVEERRRRIAARRREARRR
jgi:hypothetical protein